MRYLIFIFLLCLISCYDIEWSIDSRLSNHVNSFYIEASKRNVNIKKDNLVVGIKSGIKSEYGAIAITKKPTRFSDKQIYVWVDEDWYNEQTDELCIETTVYHELGHALLNRDHSNQNISLMNVANTYGCYRWFRIGDPIDRDNLLDELFYGK